MRAKVTFARGDMTADHGRFDYGLAMDSLIYYGAPTSAPHAARPGPARTDGAVVFTVAPKTPFLMTFWTLGKLFPRADRSPGHGPTCLRRPCAAPPTAG